MTFICTPYLCNCVRQSYIINSAQVTLLNLRRSQPLDHLPLTTLFYKNLDISLDTFVI